MGIRGARSLLDTDPNRYGKTWRWNYGVDDIKYNNVSKYDGNRDSESNNNSDEIEADEAISNCIADGNGKMKHKLKMENLDDETDTDEEMDRKPPQKRQQNIKQKQVVKKEEDNGDQHHSGNDDFTDGSTDGILLLVDGMSLLYHVAIHVEYTVHASPATVRSLVYEFVSKMLHAIKDDEVTNNGDSRNMNATSELHIFLDGIPPIEKVSTQVARLHHQAINGDLLARGEGDSDDNSLKVLHLFAEWSMYEALDELQKVPNLGHKLHLHRASRGEAETYIEYFLRSRMNTLAQKQLPKKSNVFIIADDTDFLVYPSCPGFTTFKSLKMEDLPNGKVGISGFQYLRTKFLESFLPKHQHPDPDMYEVMPVVAALAGCDYVLDPHASSVIRKTRDHITQSDVGALKNKQRNQPSSALILQAILRFIAHHIRISNNKNDENINFDDCHQRKWLESLASNANSTSQAFLLEIFSRYRKIYTQESLSIPILPSFENKPTSPDIRRLLENAVIFCRPLIEYWRVVTTPNPSHHSLLSAAMKSKDGSSSPVLPKKRMLEVANQSALDFYAIVISPPFSRQIATWIRQDSVWSMPHFAQARLRLYCLIIHFAKSPSYQFVGGNMKLHPMWTSANPTVTEYVRVGTGTSIKMVEKLVEVPDYKYLSTGWKDEKELFEGNDKNLIIDRASLFCILGNPKQAKPALIPDLKEHGILFLASLLLPYNLALLLILMGTAPTKSLFQDEEFQLPPPTVEAACNEINKVLPLLSVACYHSILVVNTLGSLYGKNSDGTSTNDDDGAQSRNDKKTKTDNDASPQSPTSSPSPAPSMPPTETSSTPKPFNTKDMYEERTKKSKLKNDANNGVNFLSFDKNFQLSSTFQHDIALWIWQILRTSEDLEQLRSEDSDDLIEMKYALEYLENCILELSKQLPMKHKSSFKQEMKNWFLRARLIWLIWWEVFDVTYTKKPLHEKITAGMTNLMGSMDVDT